MKFVCNRLLIIIINICVIFIPTDMDDMERSSWPCNMFEHVFLPRRLQARQGDLHQMELELLAKFNEFTKLTHFKVGYMFENMKQLHCGNAINPKVLSQQLGNLKPGEMLGIYVRAQNCGFFIHMPETERANEVTLATFSASLPNEIIYGNSINGDIQVKNWSFI